MRNKIKVMDSIEMIEKEIVDLGYLSPQEFLNTVENISNSFHLNIVKNNIKWATYQERKNGDVLCYTHMFSTINTNKKPTTRAPWMLPSSPLPDYIYLTFLYFFDFTFNVKTKEIKNLKVGFNHHNHQKPMSPQIICDNTQDKNIKDLLLSYIKSSIENI
jgi:hypothetical protein